MCIPELIGFTRRVERIPKEDQTVDTGSIARDIGRDPAAHGFASDEQSLRFVLGYHSGDHRTVPRLKLWLRIRHPPLLIHIIEIELDREKTTPRKFGVEIGHERRVHSLTRAMSEHNRDRGGSGVGFEGVK